MKMKYVIMDGAFPRLFTECEQHIDVARRSNGATSAGFCHIVNGNVEVFGESISLNLKSHPDDAFLIQKMLFGT